MNGADMDGLVLLVSLVARWSHLDILNPQAYKNTKLSAENSEDIPELVVHFNSALQTMRRGFSDAVGQFTAATDAGMAQSLLRRKDLVKYIMALAFSPIEELQFAAQSLLTQAYDVFDRAECFREILKACPTVSLNALVNVLATFEEFVRLLPDGSGMSKSLVRCMADIIQVLTNGRNGLFWSGAVTNEVQLQTQLPHLWDMMCRASSLIFKHAPGWSKVNEADNMTDWMRDALIFFRDLLAQRASFENAATGEKKKAVDSDKKTIGIGRAMLESLRPALPEATRWLRLTDLELLHQTSVLIVSLIETFRLGDVPPSEEGLDKLERLLENAKKPTTPATQKTKLSESQLAEIAEAVSYFRQDDGQDEPSRSSTPVSTSTVEQTATVKVAQKALGPFVTKQQPKHKVAASLATSYPKANVSSKLRLTSTSSAKLPKALSTGNSLMAQVRSQAQFRPALPRIMKKPEASVKASSSKMASSSIKDERGPPPQDDESSSSSSSDSDDDDDDDEPSGLAALGKLQKTPVKIKKRVEKRGIKLMEPEYTKLNPALERIRKREEAQRAAFRLKPDLRPLHRIILSWDYDHNQVEPPGNQSSYRSIPDVFNSEEEYYRIFEPLLALECWSQLVKSKEEATSEILVGKINSRQYIDEWVDVDISVSDRIPDKWRLSEMDIVLLRSIVDRSSVLGKVQAFRRIGTEIEATVRYLPKGITSDAGINIGTQWQLSKVFRYVILFTLHISFVHIATI